MKIKEFLGMLVLDSNANEVGKIVDAEFDKETGKLTKIGISLRKNILSSSVIEVDFDDIKSIGDRRSRRKRRSCRNYCRIISQN